MLGPENRTAYTKALEPPAGYQLDQALATTYSLDPATLLSVPLHLAMLSRRRDDQLDGLSVLESLRRTADKVTVYAHWGRMQVPRQTHILYSMLEPMVVEAMAPRGGAFHPKLWVLRYTSVDNESPLLRLLVLSRNLTPDRSWDTCLQLEGHPKGSYVAANRALGEFISGLPGLALGDVAADRRQQAERIGDELRRTAWLLPPGYESVQLHVLGLQRPHFPIPKSRELVVFSPFLSDEAVCRLAESTDNMLGLVSRPASIDALAPATLERLRGTRLLVLDSAAETEDGEDLDKLDTVGLHAKVFALREPGRGRRTHLFVGSANASSAALLGGLNVEVLAELVGRNAHVGGPGVLLSAEKGHLGALLVDHAPMPPAVDDSQRREALRVLEEARNALAAARMKVACSRDGDLYKLVLRQAAPLVISGLSSMRVWPLTVSPELGVAADSLLTGEELVVGRFAAASLTGLMAFEISTGHGGETLRFGLNMPISGVPKEREEELFRTVIRNRDGFLRYLLLLLGDLGGAVPFPPVEPVNSGDGGSRGIAGFRGLPLLEEMTKAFARSPERLEEIRDVVERLTTAQEGEQIVPSEFLEVWKVFLAAMERRP